ncbi:MAG: hypothetical protein PHX08_08895 [Lachnospiraceae bacterium]|nr:hypothetical protein [Lachnospiraceae bacterium]
MAYKMSEQKSAEIRRLNKLVQNKESRIRSKIDGAVGIYGKEKFPIKKVGSFSSTYEANQYIKETKNVLDRNNYNYVNNVGNSQIKFIPKQLAKTFYKHQSDVNKSISSVNNQIKTISENAMSESTGMTASKYRRMSGRIFAGMKSGISGYGADFIQNSTNSKFLRSKMEKQAKKNISELTFEKKKMENYQKLYSKNLKNYMMDDNGKVSKEARKLSKEIRKMDVNRFATLYYQEALPNMDDWWDSDREMRLVAMNDLTNQITSAIESNTRTIINYDEGIKDLPKSYEQTKIDLREALKQTQKAVW